MIKSYRYRINDRVITTWSRLDVGDYVYIPASGSSPVLVKITGFGRKNQSLSNEGVDEVFPADKLDFSVGI